MTDLPETYTGETDADTDTNATAEDTESERMADLFDDAPDGGAEADDGTTANETTREHTDPETTSYEGADTTEPRRVELAMPGDLGVYHRQRHRGGDETIVLLSGFADGYQVFAMDVDAGGQILETEVVGDAESEDRAVGIAEYWCQQNPKGILGGQPDGGGFLDALGFGGGGQ